MNGDLRLVMNQGPRPGQTFALEAPAAAGHLTGDNVTTCTSYVSVHLSRSKGVCNPRFGADRCDCGERRLVKPQMPGLQTPAERPGERLPSYDSDAPGCWCNGDLQMSCSTHLTIWADEGTSLYITLNCQP
jgi:hypothetical protein